MLAQASVRRPVFTLMVTLIIMVLGITSLGRLQIDLLPSIELPTVTVRAQYPGADPLIMEQRVTRIMEEIIATVPGVITMTSRSYEGNSRVRISFDWGTDVEAAALEVRATLEDEIEELPDDLRSVRVDQFDVDSFPVVLLGISSTLDPVQLTNLVENRIRYRLARIPGVAQVDPWGGFNREVRVELDPLRVNGLGLPLRDVLDAIRNANLSLPAGTIEEGGFQFTLRAPAEFTDIDQILGTAVGRRDGIVVTLGQVAKVLDTYQIRSRRIRIDGQQGLRVAIRKQPGGNTVDVSDRVLEEVAAINRDFPHIKVVPVINQGNFIERAMANVAWSVLYGGLLAILVLWFFLQNIRSTLVVALAIPISLIATFAMLYLSGFTLNLMSLGGLALGIGMMVDSSVVVLENIFRRYQEQRDTPSRAAIEGTGEVGSAVIAGTLTTLVIFLPLIFIQGISGILFRELAYVIMFSLLAALLISLSLVPVMGSKMLGERQQRPHMGHVIGAMQDGYAMLIHGVLKWRWITLLLATGMFAASLMLARYIGTEFIPPSDEGEVRVAGEMEVGTRIDLIDAQTRLLEDKVFEVVPELISSVTSVQTSGTWGRTTAKGEIRMALGPATERSRSNTQIAADLRQQLDGVIPGMTIRVRAPQGQFLLDRILPDVEGVTVDVSGYDLDILDHLAHRVQNAIRDVPGVTDVRLSRTASLPQQAIIVDREKAADLGLTIQDLTRVVETAVAGSVAGEYRVEGNSYRILVQLENARQRSLEEILDLAVHTPDGELVALRNLVSTQRSHGPVAIERKDQQRLITVTANLSGRPLGAVAADIQDRLDRIPQPEGYHLSLAGTHTEQEKASRELRLFLLLALVLVYMVLAAQYESLIDPFVVMLSVPFAATGVLLTLFLTDTTLNLQSGIGVIILIGIGVNNAILLVDQAGKHRRGGMTVQNALITAGRKRLRPVLMTTLTTILALLPLALGYGEGADAQSSMARVVLGGLLASTAVTLVLVPAVYSLVYRDDHRNRQNDFSVS